MNETMKLTIEEWANDNLIDITDKQIKDLTDAIDICSEMESGSRGFTLGYNPKSQEDKKIEELEKKLHTLECFIGRKGFSISYDINRVVEHTMVPCGTSHMASSEKIYNF